MERFESWKERPIISHMMFAVDLVLFVEANTNQIDTIVECLQAFGEMSGHRVSTKKTQVYFSPNVTNHQRREICRKSQFNQVEELGKYLGANVTFPRRRKDRYVAVVERV